MSARRNTLRYCALHALGFVNRPIARRAYNGHLAVHRSLLGVVLSEQPPLRRRRSDISVKDRLALSHDRLLGTMRGSQCYFFSTKICLQSVVPMFSAEWEAITGTALAVPALTSESTALPSAAYNFVLQSVIL